MTVNLPFRYPVSVAGSEDGEAEEDVIEDQETGADDAGNSNADDSEAGNGPDEEAGDGEED